MTHFNAMPTRKCRKCGKQVRKEKFQKVKYGKLSYACDDCRVLGMPKVTSKKTPEVEKFRINSHEEKHAIRLSAKEALERAKKMEDDLIKSGKIVAIRGSVRSVIYKKI